MTTPSRSLRHRPLCGAGALAVGLACALGSRTSEAESRHPVPALPWLAAQLVPSPGAAWDRDGRSVSLRWEVAPFLYSWGVHRSAPSHVRTFVVEPSFRNTGSVEVFGGPEWIRNGGRWVGRGGLRSTFPALGGGESLSISTGVGVWSDGKRVGPTIELGAYVLFGVLGAQLSHSAGLPRAEWTTTLVWRVL